MCDIRIFPHPHWLTIEDNIDTCYRVTVRLRSMSPTPRSQLEAAAVSEVQHSSDTDDDTIEFTQEDIDVMRRPLSLEEWRRLEEVVDQVDETNDPDLRAPLVLYAPVNAPWATYVDLEADMGFPEDYLGESDRVIR